MMPVQLRKWSAKRDWLGIIIITIIIADTITIITMDEVIRRRG
jgi:hypothetical protein